MNRNGLMLALAVAAVTGVVFGVFPELDLKISGLFHDADAHEFLISRYVYQGGNGWVLRMRDASMWIVAALAAPSVVALLVKMARPNKRLLVAGRAVVLLLATLALAPGLLANVILKDHWGRPRPIDVRELGGTDRFVPWWDPRGECPTNCSFISGEGSGAFWTIAPAALAPPPLRVAAYGAAVAFGAAVSTLRVAFGGHFFTDVVSSGVFTFLIIWTAHGLLYRWPTLRISDETIERRIERIAARFRALAGAGSARIGSPRGIGESSSREGL